MRRKLIVAALALLVTHAAAAGATSPAGAEPSPRLELTRNSAGTNGLRFDIARPHRMDRAPASSVVADLDGDPWPDLATALSDADSIVLLMDEALDDQERRVGIHVTGRPFDLAAGDLDGDGHVDLVCSLLDTGEFDVLRGLGGGAFAPALAYRRRRRPAGPRPRRPRRGRRSRPRRGLPRRGPGPRVPQSGRWHLCRTDRMGGRQRPTDGDCRRRHRGWPSRPPDRRHGRIHDLLPDEPRRGRIRGECRDEPDRRFPTTCRSRTSTATATRTSR